MLTLFADFILLRWYCEYCLSDSDGCDYGVCAATIKVEEKGSKSHFWIGERYGTFERMKNGRKYESIMP